MSMDDYLRRSRYRRRMKKLRDMREAVTAHQRVEAAPEPPAPAAHDVSLQKDLKVKRALDLFLPCNPS